MNGFSELIMIQIQFGSIISIIPESMTDFMDVVQGPTLRRGPAFGLMLCCLLENFNNPIFKIEFCKFSPMGQ